ncbi:pyrroloquinoline quinone biosynthesis protein PqqF [Pseudomonas phoenicis]|uniref:pyrroloquinoline quinone biosynthesis protein PqqF n=1 Tax=unclassified Pseudomonas TaxID=196821 RepID=UPI0039A0F84C
MPDTTRHLHLPNGLQVTLRHAPHLTRAAAALRVRAGSHDAPERWPGLAHLLEHLLFLGTARFPLPDGLMRFVQGVGGQVNATTRERTTDFFFEVPCPAFTGALERLCQMLAEPELDAARQQAEREVIHAEFIAWSRDAQAQRQFALLQGLSPRHPLRGFHAGNRYTLNVRAPTFQRALQQFHQRFYRGAQMTLSLCGPQPLDTLQALAERFGRLFAPGPAYDQAAPPRLLEGPLPTPETLAQGLLLAHEGLGPGAEQAMALLCSHLNEPHPVGWSTTLRQRSWLRDCKAQPLYAFGGQALWHVELDAYAGAPADQVQHALHDWLAWLGQVEPAQLDAHFGALQARKGLTASALQWARSDSGGLPFTGLDADGFTALARLFDGLPDRSREHWQLPPSDPLLLDTLPEATVTAVDVSVDEILAAGAPAAGTPVAGAPAAGTPVAGTPVAGTPATSTPVARTPIAGTPVANTPPTAIPPAETLAHAALHIDPILPAQRHFASLRLRWRLPEPAPTLQGVLQRALAPLQARAERAAVALRFDGVGHCLDLACSGPPAAVIRTTTLALAALRQPASEAWQPAPQNTLPPIPIRALLARLPQAISGENLPPSDATPATPTSLQRLWGAAHWQGQATGFDPDGLRALKPALQAMPGRPTTRSWPPPSQHRRWSPWFAASGEHALLLFCPVDPVQQPAARLLGHLLQGPVYQRLRVELQVGYAVFSAFRQVEGVAGLLFGVQSPQTEVRQTLVHLQDVLRAGVTLTPAARQDLAAQFEPSHMPPEDLAHHAWQAYLSGAASDLGRLRAAIDGLQQADLDALLAVLLDPAAPWLCLANRPAPGQTWP